MSSPVSSLLSELKSVVSPETKVYDDPHSAEFNALAVRWSDTDIKTPSAIVLVANEQDVSAIVRLSSAAGVPFVCRSGGNSPWSTIGPEGFVLDLSNLKKVTVNSENSTVTVQAGAICGDVVAPAFDAGLMLPLASANAIGVISIALGGGSSVFNPMLGTLSDNMLHARVVTAKGEIVEASDSTNTDLLWALRGAGQFFGVVTEATFQAHPLSTLGTHDGTLWVGTLIFPVSKASEVMEVIPSIIAKSSVPAWTLAALASPPPGETRVIVFAYYFGPAEDAEVHYAPLKALEPLVFTGNMVSLRDIAKAQDAQCEKGAFHRHFGGAGVSKFKPELFSELIQHYEGLKQKFPGAAGSVFAFDCKTHVPTKTLNLPDSAYGHRDVKVWLNLLFNYNDAALASDIRVVQNDIEEWAKSSNPEIPPATYQNFSRDAPVEHRYRGEERLNKLRMLKKIWDPSGIFTKEFL
ncbi:hypothetical protein DL96DRAFT_1702026 [Flagelloscypha sp. PMI_526]|nr:hypothetical protein DL96DRAFT_1702026 [Flagelloscypha sp. PMI_526]